MHRTSSRTALWALPLLLASCAGTRTLADPTLLIRTDGGMELGVSTDYGVIFLGSTAQAGDIDMTVWFGDGPSIEKSAIEPLGGDLFTAETEIRLPSVPLSFDDPVLGDVLTVMGRNGPAVWSQEVRVLSDPRVYGVLLEVPEMMRGRPDQIGAGVDGRFVPGSVRQPPWPQRIMTREAGQYVVAVTGGDERKNTEGLLRAWALLDAEIRRTTLLVIATAAPAPVPPVPDLRRKLSAH